MTVFLTGTATDFDDLWTKFVDHITNDSVLTAAGENWTQAWNSGDSYVFTGPGSGGTDTICVGLKKIKDATTQRYAWECRGMTHVVATATDLLGHGNPSPRRVQILLHDSSMAYWLAVSGRRFILVVKVSTYYETLYGGFYTAFLPPAEYPYPLMIGGSCGDPDEGGCPAKWSDDVDGHSNFLFSAQHSLGFGSGYSESCAVLDVSGVWLPVDHLASQNDSSLITWPTHSGLDFYVNPTFRGTDPSSSGPIRPPHSVGRCRQALGGGVAGWPVTFVRSDSQAVLGTMDGVYRIAADGVSAETSITVDGETCIAFPNIWRSDAYNFWALKQV